MIKVFVPKFLPFLLGRSYNIKNKLLKRMNKAYGIAIGENCINDAKL